MILVTLGTQDKQFTRLLNKIEELINKGIIKEKVIAQIGNTRFKSNKIKTYKFLSIDAYEKLSKECDILITHGGVGTIISGLQKNKKIIAITRLKEYNEHENNHQLEIIKEFSNKNYLLDGSNLNELESNINKLKNHKFDKYHNENKIIKLIENHIK